MYAIFVTPFRMAYIEIESLQWILIDSTVDLLFLCDIILNFFTSYYDDDYSLITDRNKISKRYFKGWFWIDFVSILPISQLLSSGKNYASLARLARLPRLYRLIKLTK